MGNGYLVRRYVTTSPDERRTFDRWLGRNAVLGLIIAAGLLVMALAGSTSVAPRNTAATINASASNVVASKKHDRQSGASSRQELATSHRD
jgi:hypothetical protein